jgi:hypothetical protein
MPISSCYLFKNSLEFLPVSEIGKVPARVRGIYVLYHQRKKSRAMDVVYVGMARGERSGAKGRLIAHKRSKPNLWTHFSVYEVWDNINKSQVEELEGLFRQIYRHDSNANKLNVQRTYKPLRAIHRKSIDDWAQ